MKKIILILSLLLCVGVAVNAQDKERKEGTKNKKGYNILPTAGDFAIGITATPFLKYAGNAFNTSANEAPFFNGRDFGIYGKYFLTDKSAIRAKLRLNIYGDTFNRTVEDDYQTANGNPLATTVDVLKENKTDVEFMAGYEIRRGYGRLQGVFGGEFGFGYASGKSKYLFGNEMNELNQAPTTADWDDATGAGPTLNLTERLTENKQGGLLKFSVGAFAGVEFFFARKMSIGGELGLGLEFSNRAQSEATLEYFNTTTNRMDSETFRYRGADLTDNDSKKATKAGTFGLKTVVSGDIFVMFYF